MYIELPAEDPGSISGKVVGKLEKASYGTRDAPQAWLHELSKTLVGIGFTMSARFPGLYFQDRLEVALVTHVDDLLCSGVGGESELGASRAFEEVRSGGREHRGQVSRANHREDRAWLLLGTRLQASGRLAGRMGLGVLQWSFHSCDNNRAMRGKTRWICKISMQRTYRRSAARLNYLAQDRPDITFAANFLARSMGHPVFTGSPPVPLEFCLPGDAQAEVTVLSDSNWAGDQATRRSTSGVTIFNGAHLLLFASRLQKTVALISGEAELNAQVMGMSEGLQVSGVREEWCLGSELACFSDSSAARGIASRAGVGRMKHLEVRQLWVQEKVRESRATVSWLSRCQNTADVLTQRITNEGAPVSCRS